MSSWGNSYLKLKEEINSAERKELEEEINFVFYLMGEMPINKWAHANVVLHFLIMLFSTSRGIYKSVFNLHVYNFI